MVVFMNKVDMVDDEELLSWDGNQRLVIYEYDGDNGPVIQGSALGWIE
jgi:elongation factor Tu